MDQALATLRRSIARVMCALESAPPGVVQVITPVMVGTLMRNQSRLHCDAVALNVTRKNGIRMVDDAVSVIDVRRSDHSQLERHRGALMKFRAELELSLPALNTTLGMTWLALAETRELIEYTINHKYDVTYPAGETNSRGIWVTSKLENIQRRSYCSGLPEPIPPGYELSNHLARGATTATIIATSLDEMTAALASTDPTNLMMSILDSSTPSAFTVELQDHVLARPPTLKQNNTAASQVSNPHINAMRLALETQDGQIAKLQASLTASTAATVVAKAEQDQLLERAAIAAKADQDRTQVLIAEMQANIELRGVELASLQASLVEAHDAQAAALAAQARECAAQVQAHELTIAGQKAQLTSMRDALAERDAQLSGLRAKIAILAAL